MNPTKEKISELGSKQRLRRLTSTLALLCGSFLFGFLFLEIGYRVLDPFPYFTSDQEVNHTAYRSGSEYDRILGWKGIPGGQAEIVTENSRFWLANNRDGFRDIEHDEVRDHRPAMVFLGDSFTWGYEVEFNEMFVSRLRERLPSYNIFNLSWSGYGTDQELLTLKRWCHTGSLRWVILMFCENDVADNSHSVRYDKPKPQYQLVQNELVLTGVPVPRLASGTIVSRTKRNPPSWRRKVKDFLYRSHFLHDVHFRYTQLRRAQDSEGIEPDAKKADLILTSRILEELKKEVEMRNARLVVCFIPSQREIQQLDDSPPYQLAIAELCQRLGIKSFDLAPHFKKTWYRTYYRQGMHWNSHGHQVAAEAVYEHLTRDASLEP